MFTGRGGYNSEVTYPLVPGIAHTPPALYLFYCLSKASLQGNQRISLRTTLFREIVANLLIHREYTQAAPGTFIIYADRVEAENANNPHGEGPIDPADFVPFPKNPLIAQFFTQLGQVEELGSGILTAHRLAKEYAGKGKAVFIEGGMSKAIIPLSDQKDLVINDTISDAIKERLSKAVKLLLEKPGMKVNELFEQLDVS